MSNVSVDLLGYHISNQDILANINNSYKEQKVFQVYLGKPQGYCNPDVTNIIKAKEVRPEIQFVVHAPFWINPSQSEKRERDLAYISKVIPLLNRAGINNYVVHTGAMRKDMPVLKDEQLVSIKNIYLFALAFNKLAQGSNVSLCLENDSGSKTGTKMGYSNWIADIVLKINSPNVRMCYDTEHSFARGEELTEDLIGKINKCANVIHFNSIPPEVKFGSFLDRHSLTSVDESGNDGIYDRPSYLLNLYKKLYDGKKLFITEVKSADVGKRTIDYIKSNL